jgi:hypothetical protein
MQRLKNGPQKVIFLGKKKRKMGTGVKKIHSMNF